MIDIIPDFGEVIEAVTVWAAAFGSGFFVHKRSAIDYKGRWKSAVETLKQEKINTNLLEETTPKPKPKPSDHFEAAGNENEFKHINSLDRLGLERERLKRGLPPKDSMRATHMYHIIAKERIAQGWDWDEDDQGWYWRMTADQKKKDAQFKQELDSSYKRGYSEGIRARTNSGYSYHDYDRKRRLYHDAGYFGRY